MRNVFFSLVFIAISISGFANEHYDRLNGKSFNIGWYFWYTDGTAYLANGRDKSSGIAIWQLTEERKWQPIHNADAYDGYSSAGNIFDNVNISSDGRTISFENQSNNNYTEEDINSYYSSDIYGLDGYYTIESGEFKYFNGNKDTYVYYQIRGSYLSIKNDYYYKQECYKNDCDSIWEGKIADIGDNFLEIDWVDFHTETLEYKLNGNKLTIIDKNFDDGVRYEYWIKTNNRRNLKTIKKEKRKLFKHQN